MFKIKSNVREIFFILFILFLFLVPGAQSSSSLFTKDCSKENKHYVVKRVFDGDTILLDNNSKIRFLGIDAFEYEQNNYGKQAKDFLTKLVLNKNVCVETDVQEKDIYGRTLGYVFLKTSVPQNLLVNGALLKSGYAILYDFPPNVKYISKLKKAQIYARQNMLGAWREQSYIKETPAQWRHKHQFTFKKKNQGI